ncbi:MAG: response regulator transcription factor [Bacteroidota bacterium]
MHKILLTEDDQSFGYILSEYLAMHDFEVTWVKSGEEALEMLKKHIYQLVILDIMLPGINGFEIAAHIKKQHSNIPFIFLSAKSLKIDQLKGFKLGAYDYITKPVDEELLVAKIRALIGQSEKAQAPSSYQIGSYEFHPQLQQLKREGDQIKLTQREADLLAMFCEHKGQLLSRKKALQEIWGATDEFSRKSMDVFVSHLRKYLAKDESVKIENIHGKGFVFSIREG